MGKYACRRSVRFEMMLFISKFHQIGNYDVAKMLEYVMRGRRFIAENGERLEMPELVGRKRFNKMEAEDLAQRRGRRVNPQECWSYIPIIQTNLEVSEASIVISG